ncbi:MAG: tRNA (adenosine(37)-N6)-dimethylallyltransferase MiaA [Bacteroidales bacterium]|nr:tRNA (adenosine(37)-N6)-dimethylallyltransferase MiaA [Bacteroidales bacterium]
MNNRYLVVLLGPTGIGKTETSIGLARHFNTEIISCDSRQFYKELSIGTAVPTNDILKSVPHHFIQHKSVFDYYNASMYEEETIQLLDRLFQKYILVFMVGGSGLYIDAVTKGVDDLPLIDPEIREKITAQLQEEGIESLRIQLKKLDPNYYKVVDLKNAKRLMKAIEISLITGKPYSSFLTHTKKQRPFKVIKIGLNTTRENLYKRINERVDHMISNGLIEEAKKWYSKRNLNALNTVGYKEIYQYFENLITLEKAIELIKRNTRHYARRQLTWFRKYDDIYWFDLNQTEKIIDLLNSKTEK